MRGFELLDNMELVDPAYLEDAEKSAGKRKRVRFSYRAAAACLCVILLLALWEKPHSGNTFSVKAYALELAEDGTIGLKETDLAEQPDVWGGYFDGENFYVNVGLKYDGNNIDHVDFITEDGFFAKQYIGDLTADNGVSKMYVGAENRLAVYGTEFEIAGGTVRLDDESMTDDLLLFWGKKMTGPEELPEQINIKANVAFCDGSRQTVPVSIDLSGPGAASIHRSDEEIRRSAERLEYYESLPLEECELLEESVETVAEVYEVRTRTTTSWVTIREEMEFDENGIHRAGISGDTTEDGTYEIYLTVIRRDADGVYTGMLYRVPQNLHYQGE